MAKFTYYFKKKIGKEVHSLSIEGANWYELIMNSKSMMSFGDVHKCGLCGSDDLSLGARNAKNKFKYVFIHCNSCKAYVNFGHQTEQPDVYYLTTRNEDKNGETTKVLDWEKMQPKD